MEAYMGTLKKAMGALEWPLLGFLSILLAGSFFFGKIALSEFPAFTVVSGQISIVLFAR
jgi:hypothetical protein